MAVGGEIRGRVGSVVFARNSHGPYSYAWQPRVDPDTVRQRAVRNLFGQFSANWRSFTSPAIRDGWENYARNLSKRSPATPCRLTGFHHYVGINTFRQQIGLYPANGPPTIFTTGKLQPPAYAPYVGVYLLATFNLSDPWRHSTEAGFALYTSRPQPLTVNHFTGPFRLAQSVLGNPANPPTVHLFNPAWPVTPRPCYLWVRARISEQDARLSPPIITRVYFP